MLIQELSSFLLVIDYSPEGCFKKAKVKIFPKIFHVVKNVNRKNPNVEQIFTACKELAEKEGYEIIAIEVKTLIGAKKGMCMWYLGNLDNDAKMLLITLFKE